MARPLKIYMRGKSVRTLQGMLKQMGYPMEDQAAIFGTSTRDAVKDFQKRKGLKDTGTVDDELFALMQQSVGFQPEKNVEKQPGTKQASSDPTTANKVGMLTRLLVSKGLISEEEAAEVLQTQPPKAPGAPLF